MIPGDGEADVHLQAPDQECQIPSCFKKNSLAVYGTIRRVTHEPGESKGLDDDEVMIVQTLVSLHKLWENYGFRAWKATPKGNPVRFSYESKNYERAAGLEFELVATSVEEN